MYSWKIIHGKHKRIALQSLIKHGICVTMWLHAIASCFVTIMRLAMR